MYKAILLSFILFFFAGKSYSQCTADFSVAAQQDTVYLEAVKTGVSIHYFWNFGDGAGVYTMDSTVLHVYQSPGLYNITLYLYDSLTNCYDSVIKQARVQFTDSCRADFIITQDSINIRTYTFVPGGNTTGDSIQWSVDNTFYGNGNNGILKHTFTTNGYYNVCLEIFRPDSCYSKVCKTIYIPVSDSCNLDASFTAIAKGDTLRAISLGHSQGLVHSWYFGDGNRLSGINLDTVQHTYSKPGNYSLLHTLRDTASQCIDTVRQYITITNSDSCSAYFSARKETAGYTFSFVNQGN